MNNYISLYVNQDWTAAWPEEGAILQFLGKNYDKDRQLTICVFEKIGAPVPKKDIARVIFT